MITPPQEPKRFGRYVLHERIGRGGMAEIFRGTVHGIDGFSKQIAIKRILVHLAEDREFVRMFIDEAKLAAHLVHRHVVQNYELGSVEGVLFIAMEYVDGRDLLQTLRRLRKIRRPMPPELAAFIVSCVCQGLHHGHTKKDPQGRPLCVIHRDVSPSNVLLSWEGDVKIGDFGIAKAATSTVHTRTGSIKGKFDYMAPEQIHGKVDLRSDIYSAGIVLWETIVGRRLFRAENEAQIIQMICSGEVPRAAELVDIPNDLQNILDKALTLDMERRFQTADDMADALNKFIYRHGKNAGARELSIFLRQIFRDDATTTAVAEQPGKFVQGKITRIAARPRESVKGGYQFRGLELAEDGSGRKIIIVLPDFTGEDIYSFPLFCRKGSVLAAYNLQLNNALEDGSIIYTASKETDLILDPTPSTFDHGPSLPGGKKIGSHTRKVVESMVVAAGGIVEHAEPGEARPDARRGDDVRADARRGDDEARRGDSEVIPPTKLARPKAPEEEEATQERPPPVEGKARGKEGRVPGTGRHSRRNLVRR